MTLSLHDVETILTIFRESGYGEIRLKLGTLSIVARKEGAAHQPQTLAAPGDAPAEEGAGAAADDVAGAVTVRAPIAGTFYRAPSPGAEPFCKPGDRVAPDTTLGLIEVMKLFTSVPAGVAGTVSSIVPGNGALVEAGQPLVVIRPDEGGR